MELANRLCRLQVGENGLRWKVIVREESHKEEIRGSSRYSLVRLFQRNSDHRFPHERRNTRDRRSEMCEDNFASVNR